MAAWIGAGYVSAAVSAGARPKFYQDQFSAAVTMACGRGFQNADAAQVPALQAFLATEADEFSCESLPSRLPSRPLASMQRAFRYQMSLVAFVWEARGRVAWSALAPLYGVFFAATIMVAYGLFRVGMNRLLAALCAAALSVSTIHLIYLPHLRDYSKAPFMLALLLIMARLVSGPGSRARTLWLALAYGVVLGIGIGFRNDLLVGVPLLVPVVMFLLPGSWRTGIVNRVAALAVAAVAFLAVTRPMLAVYSPGGGGSMQHVALLGFIGPFNQALGVSNGGLYEWGYDFKDEFVQAEVSSYATRMHGADRFLEMYGREYDRNASEQVRAIVTAFPSDMLTRAYASVIKVLALPYNATSLQPPTWLSAPRIVRAYHVRERALRALSAAWPFVIALALAALAWRSLRYAVFALLVVLYFGGIPALQFNERHFFHLEFLGWWALGFVVQQGVTLARRLRAGERPSRGDLVRPAARVAALAGLVVALLAAPLWGLRRYQEGRVRAMLNHYASLPREPIARHTVSAGEGRVRLATTQDVSPAVDRRDGGPVDSSFLVAEFRGGACETVKLDVTFRYAATEPMFDFSRTMQIRPPLEAGEVTTIMFPAFAHGPRTGDPVAAAYAVEGLELPAQSVDCLTGFSRVRDVSGLPLLMNVSLPPRWEQATPYQTIEGWEERNDGEVQPEIHAFPVDLPVTRSMLRSPVEFFSPSDIRRRADTVALSDGSWAVRGIGGVGGSGRFMYLAEMNDRYVEKGRLLVAEGTVDRGGFSLGLVRDGRWAAQATVVRPGRFFIVVSTPESGVYSVVLANNLPGPSLWNEFTIRKAGWIPGR